MKYRVTIIERVKSVVTVDARDHEEACNRGYEKFLVTREEDLPDKEEPFEQTVGEEITAERVD